MLVGLELPMGPFSSFAGGAARPHGELKWKDLSDSQQWAVENIARALVSASEDLEAVQESPDDADHEIDRWRTSRNFFVSGEPGSGKTTVYLTLRELIETPGKLDDARKELDATQEEKAHEQFQGIRKLASKSLQWLEPLDLEPAAGSTNFLAAVLVRIEKAIGRSKPDELLNDRRPGLLENRDALQKFRRLENDVVLAWDGTVPERARHVDPEVFSQDVLRAENARLQINQRLRGTLAPLARAESEKPALYVLPVDDFYLHPADSLQFLRLLRMITVPQLFILVMGDLDVVEDLFYWDQLGQLVRLVGENGVRAFPLLPEQMTGRAGALTSHALDKLIPLSQRALLEVMDELQALKYRPQRPGIAEKAKSLADLLREVPLKLEESNRPDSASQELAPDNLYEFLVVRGSSEEIKGDSYTYSGLSVLDLPPREVVDLWLSLADLVDQKKSKESETKLWDSALRKIIEQTLVAMDHDTYLNRADKVRCRDAIQGTPYDKRIFQTKALSIENGLGRKRKVLVKGGRIVTVFPHDSWIVRPNVAGSETKTDSSPKSGSGDGGIDDSSPKKNGSGAGRIDYLAPRPTAWLTVLHDLMALSEDRLHGHPLTPSPFELEWVIVSTDSKPGRSWLTPSWPTFRQFDLLAFRWNKVLDRKEMDTPNEEVLLTWVAYNWLDAITEILIGQWDPAREIQGLKIGPKQWRKLSKDTDTLHRSVSTDPVGGHHDVVKGWLLRLKIFLSGEFAIPDSVLEQVPSPRLKSFWDQEDDAIESIRQELTPPMRKIESEEPRTA